MRSTGFRKPLSQDQVTSWVTQLIIVGSFISFVATLLSRDKCLAILLPNALLVTIVITSWCICEVRDPSKPKPSSIFPSILKIPKKESHFCGLCLKNSPGLDHHCTWLNTCIADSNYEAFYWLVVSATCQTIFQGVIGILMCTLWKSEVKINTAIGWGTAVVALLWIHNVVCILLANSFVFLACFHTYLLCIGMGTYDFILINGSEGLCTGMLKCECFCRTKPRNVKHSHVHHGDARDKVAKSVVMPEPASAAVVSGNLLAPSSLQLQVLRMESKSVEIASSLTQFEVALRTRIRTFRRFDFGNS